MNQAFISAAQRARIEFHPFPAPTFKEVVKGKSISRYYLNLSSGERPAAGTDQIRRFIHQADRSR